MNKALQGRRILVTRPAAQAATLVELIAAHGGEPLLFPLLEISPADDAAPLQRALEHLADYALAIFISPNAVDFSVPWLLARRPWPSRLQVAAVGPGTAQQLAGHGFGAVIVPAQRFDSEALLEMPALQAEPVAGKKVLILRGNGGRELLADTLRARGTEVDCVSCYRRSAPADAAPLLSLLRNNGLDAATISSSEGLRNLFAMLDTEACARLRQLPLFVPHRRIADTAVELGARVLVLTGPADAGIIAGLCAHNWLQHD